MDLVELEEWCASELCGMSKSRILSILNGTPMLNSSDTSDTDNSGPSLEIISDTEEWLSDDSLQVKQEQLSPSSKKAKSKRKLKTANKNSTDKSKQRKTKVLENQQNNTIKVKKENDKVETKNQEGESLLDLLELEMRARAIRALIRKEEDIIPENEQKTSSNIDALKSALNSVENSKSKANSNLQNTETVEEIIEKIGDDEDVVLVVKPAPTIELISSDSETENNKKSTNKKSNNEQSPDKRIVRIDKTADKPDALKIVVTQNVQAGGSLENFGRKKDKENNDSNKTAGICDKESSEISSKLKESIETVKPLIKKVKKKHHLRVKDKSKSKTSDKSSADESVEEGEITSDLPAESTPVDNDVIEKPDIKEEIKSPIRSTIIIDDDEIVDLDDYPDDMYNIEPDEIEQIEDKKIDDKSIDVITENSKQNLSESTETWATRYYQTDNVQNVIKESKIQSEIRKRLRERQRLSKLNNSPKPVQATSEEITMPIKPPKPTGSVEEYFALKNTLSNNVTTVISELTESEIIKDKIDKPSTHAIEAKETISPVISESSIPPLIIESSEPTSVPTTTQSSS